MTFDDLQKPVCHSARRCGISDTTRQNKKQDARFREHDKKLLSFHGHTYGLRPYRADLVVCYILLPRFRPDGALHWGIRRIVGITFFEKRRMVCKMVGENFGKLSTSPVEPPCTKVNAAKENRNDTTYHVGAD